jgi:hypothetical protein
MTSRDAFRKFRLRVIAQRGRLRRQNERNYPYRM